MSELGKKRPSLEEINQKNKKVKNELVTFRQCDLVQLCKHEGNPLKVELIAHCCYTNYTRKDSKGLAADLFAARLGEDDYYALKYKNPAILAVPGQIFVIGMIANMNTQINPGPPKPKTPLLADDEDSRWAYLKSCFSQLAEHVKKNKIKKIAFPWKLGSGLAQGNWHKILGEIKTFAETNKVQVLIASKDKVSEKELEQSDLTLDTE
jgi:hypothetical protein